MKIYFYFFRYSLRYKWQLGSAYALVAVLAVFLRWPPIIKTARGLN